MHTYLYIIPGKKSASWQLAAVVIEFSSRHAKNGRNGVLHLVKRSSIDQNICSGLKKKWHNCHFNMIAIHIM